VSQSIIDAEIAAAKNAGLKYWAFLMYGQSGSDLRQTPEMMAAWNTYQTSAIKAQVPWCAMIPLYLLGSTGSYTTQVSQIVGWMQQAYYLKVLSGRPVLYIYWTQSDLTTFWGGSLSNVAAAITALRSAVTAAGLSTPYVVVMNGAETTVYAGIGADAISSYTATGETALAAPYATLDSVTQAYWTTLASKGVPIVPPIMAGFDRRPRVARPVGWEVASQRPYFGLNRYFAQPTTSELAAHVQAGVNYIVSNPTACPSLLGLIYAWNECDEGGWLLPTIGDPTGGRLSAIAPVIT
jgi:hypothetical protein